MTLYSDSNPIQATPRTVPTLTATVNPLRLASRFPITRESVKAIEAEMPYVWIVQTRYLGATNTKGTRVAADLADRKGPARWVASWDHSIDYGENHLAVALACIRDIAASDRFGIEVVGRYSTDRGLAFVFRSVREVA